MAKGRKTGGRKPGSLNKTTAQVKSALNETFEKKGGVPAMLKWAKQNETEFYKLWIKLLPAETLLTGDPEKPIQVSQVWRFGDKVVQF